MRILIAVMLLLVTTTVSAQVTPPVSSGPECWPSSHIDRVVVHMSDGTIRKGSLLCLGIEALTLAEPQTVGRIRLDDITSVRKAADPAWDGAAKGASIGLLMLVLCGGHCPAEVIVRTTVGYGLLGLAIDAIDTHAETIYRRSVERRAAVGFHVSF